MLLFFFILHSLQSFWQFAILSHCLKLFVQFFFVLSCKLNFLAHVIKLFLLLSRQASHLLFSLLLYLRCRWCSSFILITNLNHFLCCSILFSNKLSIFRSHGLSFHIFISFLISLGLISFWIGYLRTWSLKLCLFGGFWIYLGLIRFEIGNIRTWSLKLCLFGGFWIYLRLISFWVGNLRACNLRFCIFISFLISFELSSSCISNLGNCGLKIRLCGSFRILLSLKCFWLRYSWIKCLGFCIYKIICLSLVELCCAFIFNFDILRQWLGCFDRLTLNILCWLTDN